MKWQDDPRRLLRDVELRHDSDDSPTAPAAQAAMIRHAVLFVAAELRELRDELREQFRHGRTDVAVPLEAIAESTARLAEQFDPTPKDVAPATSQAQAAPPLPATVELTADHTLMLSLPDAVLRAQAGRSGVVIVLETVLDGIGHVQVRGALSHDQADRLRGLLESRPPADH